VTDPRHRLLLVAALLRGASLLAQTKTSPAITPQDLRQRLTAIADDSMGGRRSGSVGDFKTYAFDVPGHPLHYYCRADHYSYARYGIPSVALSRGEHLDYHQVTDEAQYIDYDDLARVARLVRDAALRIANLDRRPALDHPKGDPHAPCVQ
jgi:hypothetical protein